MDQYIIIIGVVAGLSLLIWVGRKIKPKDFADYTEKSGAVNTFPLPEHLPPPVARFYRNIYGDDLPLIDSFVITGRGNIRFQGVTLPARLRFIHQAGKGYRHYIETTLWGFPIMKVNEHFLDGQSRLALPFGVVENEPQVDEAANLGLWSETMMFSAVYLSTTGVRWEPIDQNTARLVVPFKGEEDHFIVYFNEEGGMIDVMEAMRWKNAGDDEKTGWQAQALEWGQVKGWKLPTLFAAQWMDEESPWLVACIEDVVWNTDVGEYIKGEGP